jgi:hypothetical protein
MIVELNRKRRNAAVLFRKFPGMTQETTNELIHDSLCPTQILSPASPEYYYRTLESDYEVICSVLLYGSSCRNLGFAVNLMFSSFVDDKERGM